MRARFAITTVPPQDTSTETLPTSPTFLAVRYGFVALTIPIVWYWLGMVAGAATAVSLAAVILLFGPRALVLDEQGFRLLSLFPRKKVLWGMVDSFRMGSAPRTGTFVVYTKAGRRPRWWWPARGGMIPRAFAPKPGGRALSASDLADLLNDRLVRARAAFVPSVE